jgi:hypothetical protein
VPGVTSTVPYLIVRWSIAPGGGGVKRRFPFTAKAQVPPRAAKVLGVLNHKEHEEHKEHKGFWVYG